MILNNVTNETILEVLSFVNTIKSDKFYPRRKQRFCQLSIKLSEEARFLFTWACNFSLFNSRFYAIDISKYHTVRIEDENKTTFKEFVCIVKDLQGKRITATREKPVIEFISRCDKQFLSFYTMLLERTFHLNLPHTDLQNLFDLDEIDLDDTYAILKPLDGSTGLNFPVAITKISNLSSIFMLHSQISNGTTWRRTLVNGKPLRLKTKTLDKQKEFLKTPAFTIAGYLDADLKIPKQKYKRNKTIESLSLTPTDFFKSYNEYSRYYAGLPSPTFKERIQRLNKFLTSNFTTQIADNYVGFATDETELVIEVRKVLGGNTDPTFVLLTDNESAKTNKIHAVETVLVQTIIDDYWVHEGSVLGFLAWHNGRSNSVSFSFSGKNNVLLNSINLVKGKVLQAIYVNCDSSKVYVGTEIKFAAKSWRVRPIMGTDILLSACAMCGSGEYNHMVGGLCKTCYNNLNYYYESYGPDADIKPSKIMAKKRRASGWEYSLLNLVNFRYKGTYIECIEDGQWKFRSDEKAELEYNFWQGKFGRIDI